MTAMCTFDITANRIWLQKPTGHVEMISYSKVSKVIVCLQTCMPFFVLWNKKKDILKNVLVTLFCAITMNGD